MRTTFFPRLSMMLSVALLAFSLPPSGARAGAPLADHDHDRDYPVKAEETIRKSFTMPAGHKTLEIDNIFGSIEVRGEVTGSSSSEVQIVVAKSIRAESNDTLERARKEVTLDIDQNAGALKLYVNGPFRCHCDDCNNCGSGCGSHEGPGYVVKMDFKVQVPAEIDLKIRTVNEGIVKVSNVTGNFAVHNVNGHIEMSSIAGSGTATTVNGPVSVSFRRNPSESSDFRTVNGNVELRFAGNLSADFRLKTFNGGIYSDFPVTALPGRPVAEERHGTKVILRADRFAGARIGSGGPEIKVENLNGDIRILENHE